MSDYACRSARVLLLDGADRLLFIRLALSPGPQDSRYGWFTPGGGVENGEGLADAAARELHEEIGLCVDPADLRLVAFTTGTADLGWASGLFRDDFFFYRVSRHVVSVVRLMDYERRLYGGHRWWTQPELAATNETVYPLGLAPLMADLLTGNMPNPPIALPWRPRGDGNVVPLLLCCRRFRAQRSPAVVAGAAA